MGKTRQIALCGVLAALAVAVMALGGSIPMATYCVPVLAALLLVPITELCGRRLAWAWFLAVSVLGALLCPDIEASALFLCLGYYPIIQRDLLRIPNPALRLLSKLLLFNAAIALMYLGLIFLLGLESVARNFIQEAPWILVLTWVLGNGTFWMTDLLLLRLTALLRHRLSRKKRP